MSNAYRIVDNKADFEAFKSLLRSAKLPADDLDLNRDLLVGYYENDTMVGTGGLEIYGDYALLRSLSVRADIRGKSIGTTMTNFLLDKARQSNIKAVYLLTETARDFFLKKTFSDIDRSLVPEAVKSSSEFQSVCPVSARAMVLDLRP